MVRLTKYQRHALEYLNKPGWWLVWSAKPYITDGKLVKPDWAPRPYLRSLQLHANTAISFARHKWIAKADPKVNKYTLTDEGRKVLGIGLGQETLL